MFKIWCVVYGGVTGHRESFMKSGDGKELEFTTREQAEKSAPTNRTTERGVTFQYSVVEV